MPTSNLTPLSVVSYTDDYIVSFVKYKTGWSERSEVTQKTQLIYLLRYLRDISINCKTIVAEDEYIDRHFLEDYAEYYARCFPSHPRKCSRLHFFSDTFDEHLFKTALEKNDRDFIETLSKNYLGFAVIRPIPHTFFAKLCLKPFGTLVSKSGSKILRQKVSVSLFGIELSVETIPFIEQDKVVSACATSALWMALSATTDTHIANLPSPSAITKSATHLLNEGARVFPTSGLTPPQVAHSLAHYGLTPTIISLPTKNYIDILKELIYAYVNCGIPLILGGDVYEKNSNKTKKLGRHLVCVVGFNIPDSAAFGKNQYSSKVIDKIYIHDDRIGPFIKVKYALSAFECERKKKSGLILEVDNVGINYFIPDVLIIGMSHKIRITYDYINTICATFRDYLSFIKDDLEDLIKNRDDAYRDKNAPLLKSVDAFSKGIWNISLTSSSKVKQELRSSSMFSTFNGLFNKTALLLRNLPKHIWVCRVYLEDSDEGLFSDILFDATEVPQGRLVIGYISYSIDSQRVWNHVDRLVKNRVLQNYIVPTEAKAYIGCLVKFFSELGNDATLNTMYGPLGLPRRELKSGEKDDNENIAQRVDVHTVRTGSGIEGFKFLIKEKKYIWVINELGDIVIGEDVHQGDEYKGHPTLIDGKPGRVAGELMFNYEINSWMANLKSRAYSGNIQANSDEYYVYLKSVLGCNLSSLNCRKMDYKSDLITDEDLY